MRKASAAILSLVAATSAFAEWTLNSVQTEPGAAKGIEHRYVVFENSETGDRASLEVAIFSTKSCRLRLVDQPGDDRLDLAEVMPRENCLAGVNGGYFDPDSNPIGLRIAGGKTIAPLKHAHLLTGVLFSVAGKVQIVHPAELAARKIDFAVECGPMLVDAGQPVHGLDATRPARRTFVAVSGGDRAALGFCSDVTLSELAGILGNPLSDFKIQRALNLDGGSSSAFWFKRGNGSVFSISEAKTVRDFIAVVPK